MISAFRFTDNVQRSREEGRLETGGGVRRRVPPAIYKPDITQELSV